MEQKKKYLINSIHLCRVVNLSKNFFEVLTPNQEKGIVYINEVSDYFIDNLNSIVSVGDILYLTLKEIKEDGKLIFSFKKSRSYFLRTPFEFEISDKDSNNKFQNLFEFTNKEIKKWKKLK